MHKVDGKISSEEMTSMIILFIFGASLVFGTAPQAKKDVGIAVSISLFFTYWYTQIYLKLCSYYPGKNLFDIIELTTGKIIGRLISLTYVFYCLYTIAIILFDFKSLLLMVDISETPGLVITLFFAIMMIYGVKIGVETLARWSLYFTSLIIFMILIVMIMEIKIMEIDNILPLFSSGFSNIMLGAYSAFTFPLGEIFIFTGIVDALRDHTEAKETFNRGLLTGGIILLVSSIIEILVLGEFEYGISYFPAYVALSRVNISIIQRMEILGAPLLLITGYLKVSVYLLVACRGLKKIFNLSDYRIIVTPTTLMAVVLTSLQPESMMAHWEWGAHIWPWFAAPFLVIYPILMFGIAYTKNKSKSRNTRQRGG